MPPTVVPAGTPRPAGVAAITGTSGLVGSAVAGVLAAAGWTVNGLDVTPGRWTTVVGDLREPSARRALLRGADLVVHAAALHAPHVGHRPGAEFWSVNVDATEALLASARRFVYISSTSVYGHALVPSSEAVWVSEDLRPLPRDIYDETKLAAERLVASVPAITLRIARCFPEPPPVRAAHLLHRGVSLNDVATAVRLAADRPAVTGVYNIAGPYPFQRSDCPALLHDAPAVLAARAPGIAAAFNAHGLPLPRTIDRVYSSAAATAALGYRPVHGVLEFLESEWNC